MPPALSPATAIRAPVAAQRVRVLRDPVERRRGVLGGRGVGVFGREPVIHRDDEAIGGVRQAPAEGIVALQIADHETAAVIVDEDGQRGIVGAARGVEANRNIAGRDRSVFDPRHRNGVEFDPLAPFVERAPRLDRSHAVQRRRVGHR